MAQSAARERALLGIEPFWEKPTLEPLLDPPINVTLPPEPIYEADVENSTTLSETDSKTRNEHLKNAWLNRCQKTELAGILCGDRLWKFCDKKAVPMTYLSLGMEGRQLFGSQEPNNQIDRISTKDLWQS